ncbi:AbrB/MazE/SpoVT family DNA-binding domain-containing protein [Pseudomonas sp. MS19]|uniref:AbrB/MazE/SpoVT family DNA-binding domain-containing protein n=1 Tax=Pseudomonas sp. MS19 TaxID=2579939 RepID=UPI00156241A5|nr:AbrB/MazE/SpoVT family DNA-binding domain-containing protein [Pseudomonas sp. MS19]NRH26052.1 AbrB/MazE/SpoVT family DNA-binding domain-containing protein [Pseudomonas sp. MS19]
MTWTVKIEHDDEDGGIVPLPDELLAELGVGVGDSLYLSEQHDADGSRCLILSKTPRPSDGAHNQDE